MISRLLLVLLAGCSLACGVKFRESFQGTELFWGIELAGERVAGSQLAVNLILAQGYSVPVRLACFYEDGDRVTEDQGKVAFEERATKIGEVVLEPASGVTPGDGDLPPQRISFPFTAPEPGKYFLACLTPAAPDNGLSMTFRIS